MSIIVSLKFWKFWKLDIGTHKNTKIQNTNQVAHCMIIYIRAIPQNTSIPGPFSLKNRYILKSSEKHTTPRDWPNGHLSIPVFDG